MIILTGNSLGERQKELNERINKAAADESFDKYKSEPGENDIDKIFLIDLAARHKNDDFILNILKSGDIVHITRALNKCTWLSNDEFADIMNANNLHNNIFPLMSIKMKKKLLITLSTNLKSESRSVEFYKYCMEERLFGIALKFLFTTSESFKIDVVCQKSKGFDMVLTNQEGAVANFIRHSFTLAHIFLDKTEEGHRNNILYIMRYMYSISDENYLNLLEKWYYRDVFVYWCLEPTRLGNRLSNEIAKKHKTRILKNPLLYINFLKKDKINKNMSTSDVKAFFASMLPDRVSTFWEMNFYERYKYILDIIPEDERFSFMKKIFTEKYSDQKLEMSKNFYSLEFYTMMSTKEKEDWALRHITNAEEILGSGNDYLWYKFVSFDKAFEEIKKRVLVTTDSAKRMEIINVLVDSAKTQDELERLLNYYYNRHVNELSHIKTQFLDLVIKKHNVYNFDEKCWTVLENIFYSLDVYTPKYMGSNYRVLALIYYIIKEKPVPKALNELLKNDDIQIYEITKNSRALEPEKEKMVFQYLHKFYLDAVESKANKDEDVKSITQYIRSYLDLLSIYSKTKDDIPEIMKKIIEDNWDKFKNCSLLKEKGNDFSERNIMQSMKTDAALVIKEFPLIKQYIKFGQTNSLIRKLKIYFQHDIAKKYLQLLNDCLFDDEVNYHVVQVAVYGIFKLADEPFKVDFMQKYVPNDPKIDHANIPRNLLNIQQAICNYVCMSRPPMPMACVMPYVTGDYVRDCLPMFNYYIVNLPFPACITFVEALIDKPVSIQKHGLRLAFECFSTENLKTSLNNIWKRTKNISIRKTLYKSLINKVSKESDKTQLELFEVLNTITLDLHQDDDAELFILLSDNDLPKNLKGYHLVNGWKAVKKLPEKSVNFERMTKVIQSIENHLSLVPEEEVIIITDDHVSKMLDEKEILNISNNSNAGLEELIRAKWELTLRHLANVYKENQLQKNLEVVTHIIKRCLEMRNEVCDETYVVRAFCRYFIRDLELKSYDCHKIESYSNMKIIYDAILKHLQAALPENEIFTLTLKLRLSDITRNTIINNQMLSRNDKDEILLAIKICIDQFAENFVVLIKEYINNGKYFALFFKQVEDFTTKQLDIINSKLDVYYTLNLSSGDIYVLMCVSLLKFEIKEIYLLILTFLPVNYRGKFVNDYENTLIAVKSFEDTEVQYFMFEKFLNSDFKFRSQIIPTH